jgi:acetoin utilization deacetylase AcuC-like enzyme
MNPFSINTYFDPGFAAPIGEHRMPIRKFAAVAKELESFSEVRLLSPAPVQLEDLKRVHSPHYIEAVRTGQPRELAESQKFPWTPQLFPSVLLTNGGVLAAAKSALETGYGAALASGFHHSHCERGEGFCTFNGLIVALEALKAQQLIQSAAILDMDLHYGNGTAQLAPTRTWLNAVSIYGNDYLNNVAYRDVTQLHHQDGDNHFSEALPAECNRQQMLNAMEKMLPKLMHNRKPDILLYQAGADPFIEDPCSPLKLDYSDLFERDCTAFRFAKENSIPIAWVLAGGYTKELEKIVEIHVNTFRAWREVFH